MNKVGNQIVWKRDHGAGTADQKAACAGPARGRAAQWVRRNSTRLCISHTMRGAPKNRAAGAAGCDKTAITKAVKKLKAQGLVETRRDETDARYVRLWLTEAGRSEAERVKTALVRISDVLTRGHGCKAKTDAGGADRTDETNRGSRFGAGMTGARDLTQGDIKKTILRMTGPMILGMLGMVAFNFADTAFVGQLGRRAAGGVDVYVSGDYDRTIGRTWTRDRRGFRDRTEPRVTEKR